MTVRSLQELIIRGSDTWALFKSFVRASEVPVKVIPKTSLLMSKRTLYRLQVSSHSMLGTLALYCSAIKIDHGWITILGGGTETFKSITDFNNMGTPRPTSEPPEYLIFAYDALGGQFAINGGGLPASMGEVCYFAPDTLEWMRMGMGHTAFIRWAMSEEMGKFYRELRWTAWREEVADLELGSAIGTYPPISTRQGADVGRSRHYVLPIDELLEYHQELADFYLETLEAHASNTYKHDDDDEEDDDEDYSFHREHAAIS